MLMTVNIGNSVISIGFFENECKLVSSFKISCDIKKTSDEYLSLINNISNDLRINKEDISGAIIASVVPQLTHKIKDTVLRFSGSEPILVGPGVKTGFPIRIDDPSELGGDIVSNTAAAVHLKTVGRCAIVADMGTANTVSAIGRNGEYLGCVIFPGVEVSLEALHISTAQLPNVDPSSSKKIIGKNSKDSICSGVVLGNAITVDGFIRKFATEMKCELEELELFATGEYANDILSNSIYKFDVDEHLTLKGLYHIYRNTFKS